MNKSQKNSNNSLKKIPRNSTKHIVSWNWVGKRPISTIEYILKDVKTAFTNQVQANMPVKFLTTVLLISSKKFEKRANLSFGVKQVSW